MLFPLQVLLSYSSSRYIHYHPSVALQRYRFEIKDEIKLSKTNDGWMNPSSYSHLWFQQNPNMIDAGPAPHITSGYTHGEACVCLTWMAEWCTACHYRRCTLVKTEPEDLARIYSNGSETVRKESPVLLCCCASQLWKMPKEILFVAMIHFCKVKNKLQKTLELSTKLVRIQKLIQNLAWNGNCDSIFFPVVMYISVKRVLEQEKM